MGYTKEQVLDALRKINELRPGMSIFMFSAYINVSISSRNIQDITNQLKTIQIKTQNNKN
jgi:hypothetical protein